MKSKKIVVPKKPILTPLLFLALLYWGISALLYSNGKKLFNNENLNFNFFSVDLFIPVILISFLGILFALFITFKKKMLTSWCVILLSLSLGIFSTIIFIYNFQLDTQNLLQEESSKYTFEVNEDQKAGNYYNTCTAKVINSENNKIDNIKVKLQVDKDFGEIHAGDILEGNATFQLPYTTQSDSYWQNGISASVKLESPIKVKRSDLLGVLYSLRNNLIDTIRSFDWTDNTRSEAEQLLNAIVCGQRIDLNNGSIYESFKNSGLAHLVAVSGAHLSLVSTILLLFLKNLKVKKLVILIFQSIFIFGYLVCSAIPISALRAAFMTYVAMFAFFSKRKPTPINALSLCIIIFISLDTTSAVSISFALSAGSTLGILIFSNYFTYWIYKLIPKCPNFISSALSLTISASICSQPLSVSIFNQLPLIAPISNIICTPLFSLLCGFGLVSSLLATLLQYWFPIFSQFIMWISYLIAQSMCIIVKFLSSIPYACIPATCNIYIAILITVILCVLFYLFWPKENIDNNNSFSGSFYQVKGSLNNKNSISNLYVPKVPNKLNFKYKKYVGFALIAMSCIFLIFIVWPKNSGDKIIMLDVGQGDSILVESCGKTFMIDTGNKDNLLKQRLSEQALTHIDGLFITHPDDDHCGSLDVVSSLLVVDNFYCAYDLTTNTDTKCKKLMDQVKKMNTKINPLHVGDTISFGNVEIKIIWPDKYTDNGGNCDSLTVLANYDVNHDDVIDASVLLCGDAEKNQINDMIKFNRLNKIDIYKVGHHGSKNAITQEDAIKLSPKISLFSVGANNRYGHPADTTLSYLNNSRIFRTDKNGTVTCEIFISSINVTSES